ncbi:MAG: hypothetical protein IKR25_10705 [Muribaculaceae bacterium]|nr:hypothetical protein [Muribaculaceae bacterium]
MSNSISVLFVALWRKLAQLALKATARQKKNQATQNNRLQQMTTFYFPVVIR